MLKLHVWGVNSQVSIISPECVASSWLLINQFNNEDQYEIITSCNTNLSDLHTLPVLIDSDTNEKYHGYEEISTFIDEFSGKKNNKLILSQSQDLSIREKLINIGLIHQLISKVEYINQYNLYINNRNYEGYVRKLFQNYLPFPMMYNQPLKFYNQAQLQVPLIGLNRGKVGFFSLSATPEVAETEYFKGEDLDEGGDEIEEVETKPLSALHERQLIKKSKEKSLLQESQNSLKCMNLLHSYLDIFFKTYQEFNGTEEKRKFGYIFKEKFSSSEVLLYGYIYCLTFEELPDRFLNNYLNHKLPETLKFINQSINELNKKKGNFRPPKGDEIPNLWNEVKYWTRLVEY
ncbi:Tom37 C-terminal domain-containing protein [Scheffersomyces coipomensis]|uniref:Tom37 C-terminal domain-containing protein n=1 Tax=Scheffersomyces coipomensis TaxID=1788519 RepID=UPI00315DCFA7